MARLLILFIRGYQRFLSPLLVALMGPSCRFEPSCSQYAIDALRTHGFFRGSLYAIWRILRCHPFTRGGYDPVPQKPHMHS
jgi:putative membrane protein insertion efficiency factor